MKIQIALTMLMIGMLGPLLGGDKWPRQRIDQADHRVNQILRDSIREIEAKYGIKCVGTGAAMFGGPIRSVLLTFQAVGPVSQADLRRLTVACVKDVVAAAQRIPDLNYFLFNPPFGVNNVDFGILLSDVLGLGAGEMGRRWRRI